MTEYILLGIDALITAAFYRWLNSTRRSADLIKNAEMYEINANLEKTLQNCQDNRIAYGCVEGVTVPVENTLRSLYDDKTRGLIQMLTMTEHKSKRTQGFWSDATKVIRDAANTVPFALVHPSRDNVTSVHVSQPLEARFLQDELTTTYDNFEPAKSGILERGIDRLFGEVSKGYQESERMLQIGTSLLGIGEIVLESNKVKLCPPTVSNGSYILTGLGKTDIIKKIESKAKIIKVFTAIFGITSVLLLCIILRQKYRQWRERQHFDQALEEIRQQRNRPGTNNGDTVDNSCVICLSNPREVVLLDCGHICLCGECAAILPEPRVCPVCRAQVVRFVSTYIS